MLKGIPEDPGVILILAFREDDKMASYIAVYLGIVLGKMVWAQDTLNPSREECSNALLQGAAFLMRSTHKYDKDDNSSSW